MLKSALDNYELLSNYLLYIEFGKDKSKRKHEIYIDFKKSAFFHLAGLQYLTDKKAYLKGTKQQVFNRLLKREDIRLQVEKSVHFHLVIERLEVLTRLHDILRHASNVYKYSRPVWSEIKADYFLKDRFHGNNSYLFITCDLDGYYIGCSAIKDARHFITGNSNHKITSKRFIMKKATS